jgi:hypothetical protein
MKNFDRQSDNFASRTPPFPPPKCKLFSLVLFGFAWIYFARGLPRLVAS